LACVFDAVAALAEVVPGDEGRGRHDVHARLENAGQLVDVDPHRLVGHDVWLQREQRVYVIGGCYPERFDACQLADVTAGLVL